MSIDASNEGPRSAAGGRLAPAVLAAFSAPQIALAALYFPVFVYLAPFYARERGLDLAALGAVLIGARLLDAATDPLVGWLSDRWRTRFGRRKIWLAVSTPIVCVSVWMAMVPPEEIGVGYVALWITALTLAWTLALTPYFAWSAELATDYAGRARVATWRETGFLIGTLGAAAIYAQNGGGGSGLEAIALAVVVSLPLFALWALIAVPEPQDRSLVPRARLDWRSGVRALTENRPFRRLIASHAVNSAANATPAALFLLFATGVLGLEDDAAGLILAVYFLTAIAAAPFWSWAARRWSKHRAWGVAMLASSAVFGAVFLLEEGDLAPFLIISALTGIAFGADVILPSAIQADVVDVDTAETGCQRTGIYMAVWSVVMKGASALAAGAGLIALDVAGFVADGANDPSTLFWLTFLYAGAPILLKLVAVAIIWRFPLDAHAQAELQERIEARGGAAG